MVSGTTNVNGEVSFNDIAEGTYTLQVPPPPGSGLQPFSRNITVDATHTFFTVTIVQPSTISGSRNPVKAGRYLLRIDLPFALPAWIPILLTSVTEVFNDSLTRGTRALVNKYFTLGETEADELTAKLVKTGYAIFGTRAAASAPPTAFFADIAFGGGAEGAVVIQSIPDYLAWMNFLYENFLKLWNFIGGIQWFKIQLYTVPPGTNLSGALSKAGVSAWVPVTIGGMIASTLILLAIAAKRRG